MEKLTNLIKKPKGIKPITLTVTASGNNTSEQYASTTVASSHPYTKLKIVSYQNVGYSVTGYPYVIIGSTRYQRPSAGTVYNIKGTQVLVGSYSKTNNWVGVGITVELS